MICLYDVRNVVRARYDNADTGLASQEQSRVISRANLLAKVLRDVIAVAR
jgi:hypothetical protein